MSNGPDKAKMALIGIFTETGSVAHQQSLLTILWWYDGFQWSKQRSIMQGVFFYPQTAGNNVAIIRAAMKHTKK